jgi:hypothetical protein
LRTKAGKDEFSFFARAFGGSKPPFRKKYLMMRSPVLRRYNIAGKASGYPQSANEWNSMGDTYKVNNQLDSAKMAYEKGCAIAK